MTGFSDARCTLCGGARLRNEDGSDGVCSFIPCPDPFVDVRREHPAFLPEWVETLPNGERRSQVPSMDTIIAVVGALEPASGTVVRVEANDATFKRLFDEGRLTPEPLSAAEMTLRSVPTMPDGFAFVMRRCPCGRDPDPNPYAFVRITSADACERCLNTGETSQIIQETTPVLSGKVRSLQ